MMIQFHAAPSSVEFQIVGRVTGPRGGHIAQLQVIAFYFLEEGVRTIAVATSGNDDNDAG
jgi:hypothetical protein